MRKTVPTSRRVLRGAAVPFLLGAALLAAPGQAGAASGETVTRTFETFGCGGSGGVAANELSIPAGVTSVQIQAVGGAGEGAALGRRGKGAVIRGTLAVTPGDDVYVCVGEGGGAGGSAENFSQVNTAGGAGGGYSSVSTQADASEWPFLIAAGGGGAAAVALATGLEGTGGDAGTLTADGGSAWGGLGPANYGHGGEGATEEHGPGAGGYNANTSGGAATAGYRLDGGDGGNAVYDAANLGGSGGGGGGAGFYGGGGGGGGWGQSADTTRANGGGGGGGSSRCATPASGCTGALASLAPDPSVTISWSKPTATVTAHVTPDPVRGGDWIQYTANFAQATHDGTVAFSVDGEPVEGCDARPMTTGGDHAYCVTEAPARAGTHTLEVEYSGGDDYAGASDDVDFTVETAVASLSTTSLDFGALLVGATSAQQTVTLTNTGDAAFTIGSAPPPPPPFAPVRDGGSPRACLTPCGPSSPGVLLEGANASDFAIVADACDDSQLDGGESCDVTIAFTPVAEGARAATLVVETDADNARVEVALSGAGTLPPPVERREPETRQPETRQPETGTPPPAGDPKPPVQPEPKPTAPNGDGAVLAPSARGRAKVFRGGAVTLPLACPAGDVCRVSGTLTFSTSALASRSSAAAAAKTQLLARFKGITVRGDSVRALKLRLPVAFVRAAQRAGKRSVRATLTIRTRLGGGRTITRRQQLTLLIPRAAARAQAPQPQRRPAFTG